MCFTEGFKEAAEKFRIESGIEPSVDLDSLDERIKIREMILKGQIQEAISLINSLHPELLDANRYLYFHLQVYLFLFILNHKFVGHKPDPKQKEMVLKSSLKIAYTLAICGYSTE